MLAVENADEEKKGQAVIMVGKRLADKDDYAQAHRSASPFDRLRAWFVSMPAIVRGVVLLPLWCLGRGGILLLGALFQGLAPVWQAVFGLLFNVLLLIGLFALVYKLLFPNSSLKKLFTKRNLVAMLIGGFVLTVAHQLCKHFWPEYATVSIVIQLILALLVLGLLCWRLPGLLKTKNLK